MWTICAAKRPYTYVFRYGRFAVLQQVPSELIFRSEPQQMTLLILKLFLINYIKFIFRIVLSLYDDSGSNNVLHTSFRSDLDLIHFNSIVSGQWADMKHANGVEIKSGSAAKLTVEILTDTLKVRFALLLCTCSGLFNECAHAHDNSHFLVELH
jgi:hypothetical protein